MLETPKQNRSCFGLHISFKSKLENAINRGLQRWLKTKRVGNGWGRDVRPKETGHNFSGEAETICKKALSEAVRITDSDKIRSSADFFAHLGKNGVVAVNAKFSVLDNINGRWNYGQPNMVAVNRLFHSFVVKQEIENYYVAYMTMWVQEDGSYDTSVDLVDILEHPYLIVANAGPGQCMTNQTKLYEGPFKAPLWFRQDKEKAIKDIRSSCSTNGWRVRRLQSLLDNIEIRLCDLRRDGVEIKVDTQKLRRQAAHRQEGIIDTDGWREIVEIDSKHRISEHLGDLEERLLFIRYAA